MLLLDRALRRFVTDGELTVIAADGKAWTYGAPRAGEAPVTIRLTDSDTPARIARDLSLGAGEAFMDGRLVIEEGDLLALVDLVTRNAALASGGETARILHRAGRALSFLKEANPIARARKNVEHHYDLPDALYDAFLDPERQYSCGYFRSPDVSLEQAQRDKLALIAAKLRLEPGMRVLEIGSGWGGLACWLAREHGADVTGLTLSREQLGYARARAAREGLGSQVRFEFQDYREVTGTYDRVVSIAMFEAVGRPNYGAFFRQFRDRMAPDGLGLMHTIGRALGPGGTDAFTLKYIFPGGYCPAVSEVIPHIEREGLWLQDLEVWRLHYMLTLKAWYDRCVAAEPKLLALNGERFYRMWLWYLAGAWAAFRNGGLVIHHYQLGRTRDAAPITRDYLHEALATQAAETRAFA